MKALFAGKKLMFAICAIVFVALTMGMVASAKTKITVFTYPQGDRPEWFAGGAKAFMALNPDIEVEVMTGWLSNLTVWKAGGVLPDVIHYDGQYVAPMSVQGMLMPLDDLVTKDLDTKPYIPTMFDNLRYKGKLYGLPRDIHVVGVIYNREIYQSRGMGDITKPWSWDELVKNGKKLTYDSNGDGVIDVYGFMDFWGNSNITPTWVWMAGGKVWNDDFTDTLVDTPEVIAGWKMQYDIRYTYNITPRVDDPAFKTGNSGDYFPLGTVATMMNGKVNPSKIPFDYAVAPMPIGPSGRSVTNMTLGFLGINPDSANIEAAWRLAKFLASRDGFQAGRDESSSLLSPITNQTLEIINRSGERGGEWWLAMTQVARIADGRHPSGQISITKPNWNAIIAGRSVHDDCMEIAANVRQQLKELIAQGVKW